MIKVKYPSNQGELGYVVNEDEVVDAISSNEDVLEALVDAIVADEDLVQKIADAIAAL
jgi:Mg2+/Co2+ transporter CorB